jgi:hypothetical protein
MGLSELAAQLTIEETSTEGTLVDSDAAALVRLQNKCEKKEEELDAVSAALDDAKREQGKAKKVLNALKESAEYAAGAGSGGKDDESDLATKVSLATATYDLADADLVVAECQLDFHRKNIQFAKAEFNVAKVELNVAKKECRVAEKKYEIAVARNRNESDEATQEAVRDAMSTKRIAFSSRDRCDERCADIYSEMKKEGELIAAATKAVESARAAKKAAEENVMKARRTMTVREPKVDGRKFDTARFELICGRADIEVKGETTESLRSWWDWYVQSRRGDSLLVPTVVNPLKKASVLFLPDKRRQETVETQSGASHRIECVQVLLDILKEVNEEICIRSEEPATGGVAVEGEGGVSVGEVSRELDLSTYRYGERSDAVKEEFFRLYQWGPAAIKAIARPHSLPTGTRLLVKVEQTLDSNDFFYNQARRADDKKKKAVTVFVDMTISLVGCDTGGGVKLDKNNLPLHLVAVELETEKVKGDAFRHKDFVKVHQEMLSMNAAIAAVRTNAYKDEDPAAKYKSWLKGQEWTVQGDFLLATSFGVLAEGSKVCVLQLSTVVREVDGVLQELHVGCRVPVKVGNGVVEDDEWADLSVEQMRELLQTLVQRSFRANKLGEIETGDGAQLRARSLEDLVRSVPVLLVNSKAYEWTASQSTQPTTAVVTPHGGPATGEGGDAGVDRPAEAEQKQKPPQVKIPEGNSSAPGSTCASLLKFVATIEEEVAAGIVLRQPIQHEECTTYQDDKGRVVKVLELTSTNGHELVAIARAPAGTAYELKASRAAREAADARKELCHVMHVYASWSRSYVHVAYAPQARLATVCVAERLTPLRSFVDCLVGGDLSDTRNTVAVASDVLRGLAQLHRVGIAHHDVKWSNVGARGTSNVAVYDFSELTWVLMDLDSAEDVVTDPCKGWHTPGYDAPELASATGKAGAHGVSIDLYALGASIRREISRSCRGLSEEAMDALRAMVDQLVADEPSARGTADEALRALGAL